MNKQLKQEIERIKTKIQKRHEAQNNLLNDLSEGKCAIVTWDAIAWLASLNLDILYEECENVTSFSTDCAVRWYKVKLNKEEGCE